MRVLPLPHKGEEPARGPVHSPMAATIYEEIVSLQRAGRSFVVVTLVEALGSTPQDAGAKMIVTEEGLHSGTIGGGRLEAKALGMAAEMFAAKSAPTSQTRFVQWTLREDVGMTCGGCVKLYFEPHFTSAWTIAIFGAGHVAQALVPVLLPLPCFIHVFDSRQDWLCELPAAANLKTRQLPQEELASAIDSLPDETFLLLMTQGHSTDRPVLERALTLRQFPFIGVIGSDAKAHILRKELEAAGVAAELRLKFRCPVGLPFGTSHPHEIAISIAAQLLTARDGAR